MIAADQTVRHVRGSVVGTASGAAAIVAHDAAHGGLPDAAAIMLMVAVCAATGWVVATRSSVFCGWAGLLGALAAAQIASHLVLTAVADGHHAAPTTRMVAMHAVAAAATAMLCRALERSVRVLLTALIRIVRALLTVPADRRCSWTVRTSEVVDRRSTPAALATIGTRGPPAPLTAGSALTGSVLTA
ncbi:hypothetical protein [Gordonia insulae]|uniref:Uncharacterized protein n=1 Tax=Gordonia insulae TaxID=2420509 RepID=A0A3G8JK43_9ACTN|nr:hypothetical protein [Gordonia insulae]AZG44995.1 hypothetical protein D7316_01587 [Gordonia insulae]